MLKPERILVTGAAGSLAGKLLPYLHATWPEVTLVKLDRIGAPSCHVCDLASDPRLWQHHFAGADTVIHLAGNGNVDGSWPELVGSNVDATLNVFLAAAQAGVRRVVLASSVWTMAGRRFAPGTMAADPIPDPGGHRYGATKLFGERVAFAFAAMHGISTVVLRIGGCPPAPNRPGMPVPMPDWNRPVWLSDEDFCRGVVQAVITDLRGAHVVNLVSANGPRWSLAEAHDLIGFDPVDGYPAASAWRTRARTKAVEAATVWVPGLIRKLLPARWT